MSDVLEIIQPDDWHHHLRNNALSSLVLQHSAHQFKRLCAMPNLTPPVRTVTQAVAYQDFLTTVNPNAAPHLTVYHSLYLTEDTPISEVVAAAQHPLVLGFKWYPTGATTNSQFGVANIKNCTAVLEAIQQHDLVLQIHGESIAPDADMFDREAFFIEQTLQPLRNAFPRLRIVLEHISTKEAVDFVKANDNVAATITPQHLLFNRNALLQGGVKPHYYCLPILKRESHRQSVVQAAVSGSPKFFLGTDSAPHLQHHKESACGCAGCYTAYHAMPLYAEVFERNNSLDKLENFSSGFGADFYRLTRNSSTIRLERKKWQVPQSFTTTEGPLVPLMAGEFLNWRVVAD